MQAKKLFNQIYKKPLGTIMRNFPRQSSHQLLLDSFNAPPGLIDVSLLAGDRDHIRLRFLVRQVDLSVRLIADFSGMYQNISLFSLTILSSDINHTRLLLFILHNRLLFYNISIFVVYFFIRGVLFHSCGFCQKAFYY